MQKTQIMGYIFYNKIDLKEGKVYSLYDLTKELGSKDKNGYNSCLVKDKFGNEYYHIHEVIIAEGLKLPKHLWPTDETGKRYEVDHKTPIKNGGTDSFKNLRLVSKKDNMNNEHSIINMSVARIGKKFITTN